MTRQKKQDRNIWKEDRKRARGADEADLNRWGENCKTKPKEVKINEKESKKEKAGLVTWRSLAWAEPWGGGSSRHGEGLRLPW